MAGPERGWLQRILSIAASQFYLLAVVAAWVPSGALMAFWLWVNRAELELSPERIVIRSRWRRVMRAQPRDLVLPADAAIVAEKGLVRVGGWSAGFWKLKRVSALTRRQVCPSGPAATAANGDTKRLLAICVAVIPLGIAEIVWIRTLSIASVEMLSGVLAALGALAMFAVLLWRFRMERAVPGDAIAHTEACVRPIPIGFKILFWVLVALTLLLLASILITGVPASSAARPTPFGSLRITVPVIASGLDRAFLVRRARRSDPDLMTLAVLAVVDGRYVPARRPCQLPKDLRS